MHVSLGIEVPHRMVPVVEVNEIETFSATPKYKEKGDEKKRLRRHLQVNQANYFRLKDDGEK